jgi:acetyl-CoA acetyltransferase
VREAVIVGVGMHKFGRFPDKNFMQIAGEAIINSLKDAGISWKEIQAAYCGTAYAGSAAGPKVTSKIGATGIPVMDFENACASGASAVRAAVRDVRAGFYDLVLAVGFEKMPEGMMASPSFYDWQRKLGLAANPIFFALEAKRLMVEYGVTENDFATVAVKNHKYSVHNQYSHYTKALTMEQVLNSPMVCDPLRLLMFCQPNEGAAALVICSRDMAHKFQNKPVAITASVLCSPLHPLPVLPPTTSISTKKTATHLTKFAADKAYKEAGIGPEDLDVIELQDTDAGSELIAYDQLGLCEPGGAVRLLRDKTVELGGKFPVNMSGGLMSKGEPVGASAIGEMVHLVHQLRGQAGPVQVQGAKVGLSHVIGAGGNCAVTILQA